MITEPPKDLQRDMLHVLRTNGFNGMVLDFVLERSEPLVWMGRLGVYDTESLKYQHDHGWITEKHSPLKRRLQAFGEQLMEQKCLDFPARYPVPCRAVLLWTDKGEWSIRSQSTGHLLWESGPTLESVLL